MCLYKMEVVSSSPPPSSPHLYILIVKYFVFDVRGIT